MKAESITRKDFDAICQHGQAIDSKAGYPAVVLHPDGTITKIWARKKRVLSSATLRPYTDRFIKNARELAKRKILVPEIIAHGRLENSHVRLVTYRGLPGKSIRELLRNAPEQVDMVGLCRFILELHEKGVLFRGLHFGNILQLDTGGYGLIDFTDVVFFRKPVPMLRRAANIAFPIRYRDDARRIKKAGLPRLRKTYTSLLNLKKQDRKEFRRTFRHYKNR